MRSRRKQPAESVLYTRPGEASPLHAQRIRTVTPEVAANVLRLMRRAYELEFEERGVVDIGTMACHFGNPDDSERVAAQQQRMESHISGGSSYWTLHRTEGAGDEMPLALAKTSPSRATYMQKAHLAPPNVYLNDIAVMPGSSDGASERRGYGSIMLHAATMHGTYDPEDDKLMVVADTFATGHSGPRFFARHGFIHTHAEVEPTVLNDNTLEGVRLEMNRRETPLHYLQAELEGRLPWLADAVVRMPE